MTKFQIGDRVQIVRGDARELGAQAVVAKVAGDRVKLAPRPASRPTFPQRATQTLDKSVWVKEDSLELSAF